MRAVESDLSVHTKTVERRLGVISAQSEIVMGLHRWFQSVKLQILEADLGTSEFWTPES
jgi:hypothetical protein